MRLDVGDVPPSVGLVGGPEPDPTVNGEILPRGFDYALLTDESATALRETASRIHHRISRQIDHITQIGRDLIAAKALLQHGQFTKWLATEFAWTERTARNYMNVAEVFGGETEKVSVLRPSTLYRLAAPSTPAEARARIVAIAEAGQPVTEKLVASAIRRARLSREPGPDPELDPLDLAVPKIVFPPRLSDGDAPAAAAVPGPFAAQIQSTAAVLVALIVGKFGTEMTQLRAAIESLPQDAWLRARELIMDWTP